MTIKKPIKISAISIFVFLLLLVGGVLYAKYLSTIKYPEKITIFATFQNCNCDENSFWFTLDSVANNQFSSFVGVNIKPYSLHNDLENNFYDNFMDTSINLEQKYHYKIKGYLHRYKENPIIEWFKIGGQNPYKFETDEITTIKK